MDLVRLRGGWPAARHDHRGRFDPRAGRFKCGVVGGAALGRNIIGGESFIVADFDAVLDTRVACRGQRLIAHIAGKPPVQNPHLTEIADDDVRRFHITMDDALAVRIRQDFEDFQKQRQTLDERHFAPVIRAGAQSIKVLVERLAAGQRHDVARTGIGAHGRFEDVDDARMLQLGGVTDLVVKPRDHLTVSEVALIEDLDCHRPIEVQIKRLPNPPGGAATNLHLELVAVGDHDWRR